LTAAQLWWAGPYGTWKGGREKAPAAFCRKVLTSTEEIEMWGDGKQTRSFTFIDDCVEGVLRITKSDFKEVRQRCGSLFHM
jgi:GDP-D-mannose 3',5'-epimerase